MTRDAETPTPFTSPGAPSTDAVLTIDSPLGRIALHAAGDAITRLEIARDGRLSTDAVQDAPTAVLHQAARELTEYFAGERRTFTVPVAVSGTAFQESIWRELQAIPFGGVRGYGELGQATGRASAGRAVGGAVGANPIPLLIPCHRVLASDARITGYSAGDGIPTKTWLLDHESIAHR